MIINKFSTLILLMLCITGFVPVVQGSDNPNIIVLIEGKNDKIDMKRLKDSVDAHMSDLNALVILRRLEEIPENSDTQFDVMRTLASDENALAVVWMEPKSDNIMMMVSDRKTEQSFSRSLSEHTASVERVYDAAASMVRAALTPWFYSDDNEQGFSKNSPLDDVLKKDVSSTAVKPQPAVDNKDNKQRRAAFFASYAFSKDIGGVFLSGAAIGLGAITVKYLEFELLLRLFQPADLNLADQDARLFRLPLTIRIKGLLTKRRFMLGLSAGVTFDFARVLGIDEENTQGKIHSYRPGFSFSVLTGYYFVDWLRFDLQGGMDIFRDVYEYHYQNAAVFTNGAQQISGIFGLTFLFITFKDKSEASR